MNLDKETTELFCNLKNALMERLPKRHFIGDVISSQRLGFEGINTFLNVTEEILMDDDDYTKTCLFWDWGLEEGFIN